MRSVHRPATRGRARPERRLVYEAAIHARCGDARLSAAGHSGGALSRRIVGIGANSSESRHDQDVAAGPCMARPRSTRRTSKNDELHLILKAGVSGHANITFLARQTGTTAGPQGMTSSFAVSLPRQSLGWGLTGHDCCATGHRKFARVASRKHRGASANANSRKK
jgi:hypothetical protein